MLKSDRSCHLTADANRFRSRVFGCQGSAECLNQIGDPTMAVVSSAPLGEIVGERTGDTPSWMHTLSRGVKATRERHSARRIRYRMPGQAFLITDSQTPAADHRLQRASHHGHLTDPDKEPTAAIVDFSRLTYEDALARNFR